ncbi:hypothetical protein AcW1_009977 [Taiwanofungus camphoratus]|nr:hypothetical protein AcV7_005326 [Antrodia cinnamomea]KAI0946538.1 hypothetical protein AcW1_009977 [Antrodia cinnamomea]
MSSDASNTLRTVQTDEVYNYCQAAVSALVLYEYLITIGQEAKFFWGSKVTGGVIIFYLNRCIMLALGIVGALQICPWKTSVRSDVHSANYNLRLIWEVI